MDRGKCFGISDNFSLTEILGNVKAKGDLTELDQVAHELMSVRTAVAPGENNWKGNLQSVPSCSLWQRKDCSPISSL